jgi:hypothetical protein
MALLAATAVGVGVVLGAGGSTGASSSHASARSDVTRSEAQERYAIFRRARTDADAMLTGPQLEKDDPAGMDPSEARLARSDEPGWRVWAIPAADGICVGGLPPSMGSGYGPASVCGGAETIADGVVATSGAGPKGNRFFRPDEVVVFGLVPDGVAEVVIDLRDGASQRFPVKDNAFHADLAQPTRDVWYRDGDGNVHRLGGASWDGVDGDA